MLNIHAGFPQTFAGKIPDFLQDFRVKFQIFQSQALQMSCILNTGLIGVVNVHIRY